MKFSRMTNFTGRNGYGQCSGVEVLIVPDDKLILIPLTSKGKEANCDFTIPIEDAEPFIKEVRRTLPTTSEGLRDRMVQLYEDAIDTITSKVSTIDKEVDLEDYEIFVSDYAEMKAVKINEEGECVALTEGSWQVLGAFNIHVLFDLLGTLEMMEVQP